MRLVLGPGRWSCDWGGWFSGPPGGACSMGRGGRRSRGNPKGVPLARFGRGKFSTASAGQLSAKRYRKNLKAKTYRFRGGAIRRDEGGRFGVKSSAEGGAIRRDEGGRFGVNNSLFPQLYQHGTSLSSECVPVPMQKERGGRFGVAPRGQLDGPPLRSPPHPPRAGAVWRQDGARLGRSGRWPLAASPVGSEREGASLEGRPGFRVSEKAPRGRASWRQKRAGQTSRLSPSPLVRNRRR